MGELGADGDDEADENDDEDMLLVPSPLKGAKVAPCGELASPEMLSNRNSSSIRNHFWARPLNRCCRLPLAVAGDKLRPVGGPVDELANSVALTGVVGDRARPL